MWNNAEMLNMQMCDCISMYLRGSRNVKKIIQTQSKTHEKVRNKTTINKKQLQKLIDSHPLSLP